MSQNSTPGILQQQDPKNWQTHRFGLPAERWNSLCGKSFWITGGGTGYGRCIALALAAAGSQVFITGRRLEKLEETRMEAISLGIDPARLIPIAADIMNPGEVQMAAEAIGLHTPQLHGLVNCAALPPHSNPWPLADISATEWDTLLTANVTGQWLVSKAALPLMAGKEVFRIIFMTSAAGWGFAAKFGPYNVSKAAINSLGASLAAECAARYPCGDVQINMLEPGEAHTEMNQGSAESPFSVVCMALALLSQPTGGPNGCFFHRDGRHLAFAQAQPYERSLLDFAAASDLITPVPSRLFTWWNRVRFALK